MGSHFLECLIIPLLLVCTFFALTNLDVRLHFNSVTFFLSFLAGNSSISMTSPSTWTVASGVRSW